MNEEYRYCSLSNPGGRSRRPKDPLFKQPIQAYEAAIGTPLKAAKWKDIQSLLEYIPPVYHQFFKNLPTSGDSDEVQDEHYPDDWEENENIGD